MAKNIFQLLMGSSIVVPIIGAVLSGVGAIIIISAVGIIFFVFSDFIHS